MAHYDLYNSLRLDRSKDTTALASEIDQRIATGQMDNEGGLEELQIARKILGDPGRRHLYDAKLSGPSDPEITVSELRSLANATIPHSVQAQAQPQPAQPQPADTQGTSTAAESSGSTSVRFQQDGPQHAQDHPGQDQYSQYDQNHPGQDQYSQYDQNQYSQGQYSQDQYSQDLHRQQQGQYNQDQYSQDQYSQQQGQYGHSAYGQQGYPQQGQFGGQEQYGQQGQQVQQNQGQPGQYGHMQQGFQPGQQSQGQPGQPGQEGPSKAGQAKAKFGDLTSKTKNEFQSSSKSVILGTVIATLLVVGLIWGLISLVSNVGNEEQKVKSTAKEFLKIKDDQKAEEWLRDNAYDDRKDSLENELGIGDDFKGAANYFEANNPKIGEVYDLESVLKVERKFTNKEFNDVFKEEKITGFYMAEVTNKSGEDAGGRMIFFIEDGKAKLIGVESGLKQLTSDDLTDID
ncbi:hypothetical protein [Corynebacterium aquatimens]|uniref:Uncharacterized protein n=1 Tax=Corynebacterium aquatimens TaxID=1190508 RepID=A0A931GXS5_9CORY|nr:hypothetical protein [Corynebacterium aquatimens]MBG6122339.1 hypothetical protein [Corynebacterium aquatimens]WJY65118.1 hypothetical protein CAQUA_01925 [Corynebacterium aquatimens]